MSLRTCCARRVSHNPDRVSNRTRTYAAVSYPYLASEAGRHTVAQSGPTNAGDHPPNYPTNLLHPLRLRGQALHLHHRRTVNVVAPVQQSFGGPARATLSKISYTGIWNLDFQTSPRNKLLSTGAPETLSTEALRIVDTDAKVHKYGSF